MIVRQSLTSGWLCRWPWLLPFSLQPVRDTREKQIQLWKDLILDFCKTQKIFIIGLEEEFPLFTNHGIESKLKSQNSCFCVIYVKLTSPINAPLVFDLAYCHPFVVWLFSVFSSCRVSYSWSQRSFPFSISVWRYASFMSMYLWFLYLAQRKMS